VRMEVIVLLRCIDIESTGEEPDIGIVEIGWSDLVESEDGWCIVHPEEGASRPYEAIIVNPGQPISPESSAIHHITNQDVIGAMAPPQALDIAFDCPTGSTVLVAHNADSDKAALGGDRGYRWIDTWKVAVTLAPTAPSYKLQVLRYWLDLDLDRIWSLPSHRAGTDAYVCAALMMRMLHKIPFEKMIEISDGPVLLPRFWFGKYRGDPIADIPTDYLEWMLHRSNGIGEPGFDKNVIHTCITEIERRRKERRKGGK
jgi:exodeoxyribonuclease X